MPTQAEAGIRVVIAARTAIRGVLHEAIAAAGIQVSADCGSARELLAAVSSERPDVCVVDRELRGGGLAAAAAIASPEPAPKVLIVGGRGSPAEVRAARLAGAADCLPDNTDPAVLGRAVAALVAREQP
jgi:DNA-binding NarL/FixJ family response regulator